MKPQVDEKFRLAGCVYARPITAIRLRSWLRPRGVSTRRSNCRPCQMHQRCDDITLSEGGTAVDATPVLLSGSRSGPRWLIALAGRDAAGRHGDSCLVGAKSARLALRLRPARPA